jgi:hypothetical protein
MNTYINEGWGTPAGFLVHLLNFWLLGASQYPDEALSIDRYLSVS